MRVTVATWNIQDGGIDDGDDTRLKRQIRVMTGLDADVWAIQEARGWAANGRRILHHVASTLEMRGRFLLPSNHHGCDLVILVRERSGLHAHQERPDRAAPWWHALHHLELRVEGQELHIMNVHLAPSSPATRLQEAQAFGLFRSWPAIAMGDFNAVPARGDLPDIGDVPDLDKVHRKLDRAPAEAIQQAGFADLGEYCGDRTPTVGHATGALAYRCDRIVTTLPLSTLLEYQVVPIDDGLSDHRPVVASLDLTTFRPPAK